MRVRFGLLGVLTLHLDEEPRPIPGPKAGLLLATLLLGHGAAPVPVDRLIATVWGDRPPRTALASLHNHFARLRSALGPERGRLHATRGAYALHIQPGELDAEVFGTHLKRAQDARQAGDWQTLDEESAGALALWRGSPATEFPSLHDAPEITHLVEQHLQAVELRFDAHLHAGREITADIARHAAANPLHEPFHRQLMTALHRADRTADAVAAYHGLRRTLADELGIDPAPATQQVFHELIALPAPPEAPPRPGTASPGKAASNPGPAHAAAPFQIPRDIPDFTGRQAELATLRERLTTAVADGLPPVVVISGMGGVGKTTLALHGAHGVRSVFPDGQLYADLRGFGSGTPRSAHGLLARFLTDLGVPARSVPEDIDDRAALYRATLAERRVLVTLDNAHDAVQVMPFLIGSGRSATVVTSRRGLTGLASATHITLQPLAPDEQHQLLAAICGPDRLASEQSATERILTACAGLPLALRIVGARLAHGGRTVPGIADNLHRTGHRLTALTLDHLDVRDVFLMSYQALKASPRRVERDAATAFRRLGLWPAHPLSAEAACALLDQPVERTYDLLDILVGAHLLENPAPNTYRFHDLLGEYATEVAAQEESDDACRAGLLRIVSWYRAATRQADVATRTRPQIDAEPDPGAPLPEFADADHALAWITAEMPAIHHAVHTAAGIQPELSWRLADKLFGWTVVNWWATRQWEEPARVALAAARQAGDLQGQARMENFLGVAHGASFRNEAGMTHFAAAADLYERIGDTRRQAQSLGNYGLACGQAGRTQEGLAAVRRAIALHPDPSSPPIATLHGLGALLLGSGDAAGAEAVFRQCLDIARREGQPLYEAIVLVTLGDSLRALDRRDESLTCLEESLVRSRRLDNVYQVADALEALARAHHHFGDLGRARDNWTEALAIAEEFGIDQLTDRCRRGLDSVSE